MCPSPIPDEQRRNRLLVILLLGLEGGLGNTVQITLARLCDAATTLVLVDLYDADLLEGLEDLAVDGAGGVNVVRGARAAVLGGTVSRISILSGVRVRGRALRCSGGASSRGAEGGVRTRGPCGDGQHRRSCACRRGGRRRRRERRTSQCPEGAARWSLFGVRRRGREGDVVPRGARVRARESSVRGRRTRSLDSVDPACR